MILYFFRQCNYKCTIENSVRDGDTSPSTSNPLPTKLNLCVSVICLDMTNPKMYRLGGETDEEKELV